MEFGKIDIKEKEIHLMNNLNNTIIHLENRRYIGSKTKLVHWISDIIKKEIGQFNSFFDVFSGTGIVSKVISPCCKEIILNDFLYSNYVVYKSFFNRSNKCNLKKYIDYYNSLNPDKIKDNYFSVNFSNKYFSRNNAKLIGYIREDIEKKRKVLSKEEYYSLITILMYSIDKIANTCGHYDAYIKKTIKENSLVLKDIENIKVKKISIYNTDSNKLAKIIKADVAYIDPPYNSRQYSRFYHIWDNIAEWKKPKLFGVALKPITNKISKYCQTSALDTFSDLIDSLNVKYMVVSYNNTYCSKSNSSRNKISLDDIKSILNKKGKTKIFSHKHTFFNAGKTNFSNHQELLFVTKVRN